MKALLFAIHALCVLALGAALIQACQPLQPPVRLCSPSAMGSPCEARLTRYVEISPSFTPEERSAIIDGAAMWEVASGGAVRFEVCAKGQCNDAVTVEKGPIPEGFVGVTRSDRHITIDVATVRPDVGLTGVAAHEFGHVLMGAYHAKDPGDLMAPTVHPRMVVTQRDLEELWRALGADKKWRRIESEPIPQ